MFGWTLKLTKEQDSILAERPGSIAIYYKRKEPTIIGMEGDTTFNSKEILNLSIYYELHL